MSLVSPMKFIFIIYFVICGGPFGMEEAVGNAYPLLTILFIIVIPLIYAIPVALITAELGTMLPTNEGVVEWVNAAFGARFSFVLIGADFITYILDLAIYPVLFVSYMQKIEVNDALKTNPYLNYGLPIAFCVVILIMNLFGVDFISSVSSVLAIAIFLPFVVMFLWCAATGRMQPSDWIVLPPGEWDAAKIADISTAFNVILWSYTGCDSIGQILEDLQDLNNNLMKTLVGGIFLTIVTYLVAVIGPLSLQKDYSQWDDGYFSELAKQLGGPAFSIVMTVAAMIGNFGIYNALLLPAAEQLQALCGDEYLRIQWLQWKHPRWNTPMPALVVCTILGASIMSFLDFIDLIQLQTLVYSIVIIVICISIIRLRYKEPDLPRPYKVCGSDSVAVLVAVCFVPVVFSAYIIYIVSVAHWIFVCILVLVWILLLIWHIICGLRTEFEEMREREASVVTRGETPAPLALNLQGSLVDTSDSERKGLMDYSIGGSSDRYGK